MNLSTNESGEHCLDDSQTEHQDEGDPEVIVSVSLILRVRVRHLSWIGNARKPPCSRRIGPQRGWNMTRAVKPTIFLIEIQIRALLVDGTLDGLAVQVVHAEDEGDPEEDDGEVCLVVELEEEVVGQDGVPLEQISQFLSSR